MAVRDKQTESLCASAPGMAARFERALVEGCVWRVALSDVPPSEWTEELIGNRIAIRATVGTEANSFASKTAALRASWRNLEAVYGKGNFSEKGSWGFPSFRLELVAEGQRVSRKVWQSVLPFFVDKPKASPMAEAAESAKPQAKPQQERTEEVKPSAPIADDELEAMAREIQAELARRAEAKAKAQQPEPAQPAQAVEIKAIAAPAEEPQQERTEEVKAAESPVQPKPEQKPAQQRQSRRRR